MPFNKEDSAGLRNVEIIKVKDSESGPAGDVVAVEEPLTVKVGGEPLVTLMFTPPMAAELALGYLASEGVITSMDDVTSYEESADSVDVRLAGGVEAPDASRLRVLTSGCGGGVTFSHPSGLKSVSRVESSAIFSPGDLRHLMDALRGFASLFDKSGGTHSAALFDGESVRVIAEDIGRHNAVDKAFGRALVEGLDLSGCALGATGRVSSEILLKCVRRGLPAIVSRGAPTSLAVELADRFGVTLIGFARGARFNIYSRPDRIEL